MYGHTDVHYKQYSVQPLVLAETFAKVEQEMLEGRCVTVLKLCERIPEPAQHGGRVLCQGYTKNATMHAEAHRSQW